MVSFNVYRSTASGAYVEGVCLATDEKPVVGIANGSILFAVDTESGETTRYMYDQNSMSWIEATLPGGGSGGSGGGSGGESALVVTLSGEGLVADKTFGEIAAALNAGKLVTVVGYPAGLPEGIDGSLFAYVGSVTNSPKAGYSASIVPQDSEPVGSYNENATASDYPFFVTK